MKLVCLADAHVHPWRLCSRDGGHDRLLDGLSVVRQSLELARANSAVWVFAGDMKQPKTFWPQQALTGLHELFREYRDVEMVMVCGNHDARGVGGSGLAPFKDVATVVETPQVVTPVEDLELVCCPWDGDPKVAAGMLASLGGAKILVAHGFLQGCMLGPEDARIAKGTPASEYGGFDVAVFGDVHKAQWRVPEATDRGRPATWVEFPAERTTIPRGSVLYCGSPYAQNWGERNDPAKGALLIDTLAQTAELVPLKAPRYVHLDVDEASLEAFLLQRASAELPGNFVRAVYTGKPSAALEQLEAYRPECRSFQVTTRRAERSQKRAEVHAGMTTPEILTKYMEARPPAAGIDKGMTYDALTRLAGAKQ